MNSATLFLVFLVFALLTSTVEGAQRNKFKTCSQSGFCERNRNKVSTLKLIESSPTKISDGTYSFGITDGTTEYVLKLSLYQNNIARLVIDETKPIKPRFSAAKSLPILLKDKLVEKTVKLGEDGSLSADDISIKQKKDKDGNLILEFWHKDKLAMSFNSRKMFLMEPGMNRPIFVDLEKPTMNAANAKETEEEKKAREAEFAEKTKEYLEKAKVLDAERRVWDEHDYSGNLDHKRNGKTSLGADIRFHSTKALTGLPEHTSPFFLKNTNGARSYFSEPYRLFNADVFEYEMNDPMALYGSMPILFSHSPSYSCGILWLNPSETWVDITDVLDENNNKKPTERDSRWLSESGVMDVFFFLGPSIKDVSTQLSVVIGNTPRPPTWALGAHQCRWNYKDAQDFLTVSAKYDEYNMPLDAVWLDIEHTNEKRYLTWDKKNFPNPKEMIEKLSESKRKTILIVDPHIKVDKDFNLFKEASKKEYFVKTHENKTYEANCWPGKSSWLDFFNPQVSEWWSEKYSLKNFEGTNKDTHIWNDMNEPAVFNGPELTMPRDCLHHGDVEHRDIHNAYGMLYHESTFKGLIKRDSNERPFVLTRSFFLGSQRTAAVWTGDNTANYDHLALTVPMLLSLSLSGITFVGADIGGFFGNPTPELLIRWYQSAAFHPFHRSHAHLDSKRREPYLYTEEERAIIRTTLRERYRMLPYWSTLYAQNEEYGYPPMRPMLYEFPEDENVIGIEDQFMVGESILVKSVFDRDVRTTTVYLPQNSLNEVIWYSYPNMTKVYEGGKEPITVRTPLEHIPVFIRGGTILPRRDRVRRSSSSMTNDPYTIVITLDKKKSAEGQLYADDGHSYNYKKGEFIWRKFSFAENKLSNKAFKESTPPTEERWAKATIERIIIVGIEKVPQKVMLGEKVLETNFEEKRNILTIKKPDCMIKNDWTIEITP